MSKEEVLNNLEEFLKGPCEICKYCNGAIKNHRKAIQGLLDLYNQEIQKNEIIKNSVLIIARRNGKTVEHELILKEYISKDKIRELIKELDNIESEYSKKIIVAPTGLITGVVQFAFRDLLEE